MPHPPSSDSCPIFIELSLAVDEHVPCSDYSLALFQPIQNFPTIVTGSAKLKLASLIDARSLQGMAAVGEGVTLVAAAIGEVAQEKSA